MVGPAQRFPSNIIRISFPAIGGLVFLRAAQRWNGDVAPIAPKALVSGLPWGDFDMFQVVGGVTDPEASLALQSESVPIADPVTDKMLQKYLYWAHYPKVSDLRTEPISGFETVIVDTANWTKLYNHVATFQLSPVWTRQQALDYFTTPPGLLAGQDPALVGVAITDNFGNLVPIPSTLFYQMAAEAGWTYHTEPGGGGTLYKQDDVACVVINLAKLFRDVPSLPNGQKPTSVEFTVAMPVTPSFEPGHGAALSWWLSGSAWSPKISDPQQDFERRTFPVEERQVPISGLPGQFNVDHLWPTFPHPDFGADVEDESVGTTAQTVSGVITFGAGNTPPDITLELETTSGEEG